MEEAWKKLGMRRSAAFTIFAKKMRRERRIPFEVSVGPFYSDANRAYLARIAAEIDSGKVQLVTHELGRGVRNAACVVRRCLGGVCLVADSGQEIPKKDQCVDLGYNKA